MAPLKDALLNSIADARVVAEEHFQVYEKYTGLIDGQADAEVDEFVNASHNSAAYMTEIQKYAALSKELQFDCAAMVRKGLFTVSCKSFNKELMGRCADLQAKLLAKFRESFQKTKEDLRSKFSAISDLALETPEVLGTCHVNFQRPCLNLPLLLGHKAVDVPQRGCRKGSKDRHPETSGRCRGRIKRP